MKLVLLPGLDGTGMLFKGIMSELDGMDVAILPLPNVGPQDYESLTEYVIANLPKENLILVAESFSGGIAGILSTRNLTNLKGIVFVAAFLSSPSVLSAYVTAKLPIRFLASLPFSATFHRWLFLGDNASKELVQKFVNVVKSVPRKVLSERLHAIAKLRYRGFNSDLSVVYIGASNDNLVDIHKRAEFEEAYSRTVIIELEGPHFILQSRPKAGANAIIDAVHLLTNKSNKSPQAASPV